MDKVSQNVATDAEEAASASEEMAAQAITLKETVSELLKLVQGNDQIIEEQKQSSKPVNKNKTYKKKNKKLNVNNEYQGFEEF
jgi:thymidylate synthase